MDFKIPSHTLPNIKIPNEYLIREPEVIKPMLDSTPKSVLILGNGFDLDLGLNTNYEDFVKSSYWPFGKSSYYEENTLPCFLNDHLGEIGTWYDLEEALAKFATQCVHSENYLIDRDKTYFKILNQKLKEYLQSQEDSFVEMMNGDNHTKRKSPAHYVLETFLKKEVRSIYTFNYTNLYKIAQKLILGFEDEYTHIHGSLAKNNIILGTGDQRNLDDKYFEFYKSANPHYKSNDLVEDLNSADEVYIFGHSLGLNDHDYFSEFFKKASSEVRRPFPSRKIKVRTFTFDEKSEMSIRKQLMRLTENHLIGLYAHCDFEILKTSSNYQADWMSPKYEL